MSAPVKRPERRMEERRFLTPRATPCGKWFLWPRNGVDVHYENRRVAERRKGDTVSTYLDLDDVCHGNPQAKEELDKLRASYIRALDERDRWREHAERRWAMRRELESLLGLEPDATFEEANFQKAVERLRTLVENEK